MTDNHRPKGMTAVVSQYKGMHKTGATTVARVLDLEWSRMDRNFSMPIRNGSACLWPTIDAPYSEKFILKSNFRRRCRQQEFLSFQNSLCSIENPQLFEYLIDVNFHGLLFDVE